MAKELTPMMKQFFDLKAKHPEALLLFRCGDFYETYCEDAVIASQVLGITLTHRNNGYNKGDEMAGFPHHALDTYPQTDSCWQACGHLRPAGRS
jgi:DNA mismatch repair protein MutS